MTELLAGRYVLGDVVGSGGMGLVYRAKDTKLDRPVAVKVLRGGPLADPHARARMHREARLAGSIHHPGVARVFDYEADPSDANEMAFLVMEFIEGRSLAQLIRDEGPMSADQVLAIILQVSQSLQAVHDAGIVHRDLKPANIMVTALGRCVLVDFGIAQAATSDPLTETGALIGTADYLSPEQAAGRTATSQSDLYALGVIAHQCLTGQSPFRRESHISTALAHIQDDLPALDPGIPFGIRDLIEALTAKDPAARPTSAAAVALRAASLGAPDAVDVRPRPGTSDPAAPHPVPTVLVEAAPRVAALHRVGSRRVFTGLAAVAVLVAALTLPRMHDGGDKIVPQVVGLDVKTATSRIKDAGMMAAPRMVDVPGRTTGEVVSEYPRSGARAPRDGIVRISVVSGKVRVLADDVVGRSYAKASSMLEKLGLVVVRRDVTRSSDAGQVVSLDKTGRLAEGSTVTLAVAVAPVAVTSSTATRSPSTGGTAGAHAKAKPKPKGKAKGKKGPHH